MLSNILILSALLSFFPTEKNLYDITKASLKFDSDAPLELIKASTSNVKGIIDVDNNAFAFLVPITSFEGFNSSLQREHFNENYMESDVYKSARFFGKIEGEYDLEQYGDYEVVGVGKFDLHGLKSSYEIPVLIHVDDYGIKISSKFELQLDDFDIKVPTIMRLKIAEVIFVDFEANLDRRF